ncbi:hypothetical protein CHS0354_011994, partial [Potamilus streckersoni]
MASVVYKQEGRHGAVAQDATGWGTKTTGARGLVVQNPFGPSLSLRAPFAHNTSLYI